MKVMVLGALGWLGGRFADYLRGQGNMVFYSGSSKNGMDINDRTEFPPYLDWVVNFAAKASVDWCEAHKLETFESNVAGAAHIAELAKKTGIRQAFVSSGDLWGNYPTKDWCFEDDPPMPAGFYNQTKYMAEQLVQEIEPEALIVRLRLPISGQPHPRNFLNKLASYQRITYSQETMTVVEDFLPALLALMKEGASGIRHLVNEGVISPAAVATAMKHDFEQVDERVLTRMLTAENRQPRRGVLLGSNHGYLPPIWERIGEVVRQWQS